MKPRKLLRDMTPAEAQAANAQARAILARTIRAIMEHCAVRASHKPWPRGMM